MVEDHYGLAQDDVGYSCHLGCGPVRKGHPLAGDNLSRPPNGCRQTKLHRILRFRHLWPPNRSFPHQELGRPRHPEKSYGQ